MGRRGVQAADVIRAYVSLKKQGREPTLTNLRLELGRGSYSTIAEKLSSLKLIGRNGRFERRPPGNTRGRPRSTPTAQVQMGISD